MLSELCERTITINMLRKNIGHCTTTGIAISKQRRVENIPVRQVLEFPPAVYKKLPSPFCIYKIKKITYFDSYYIFANNRYI